MVGAGSGAVDGEPVLPARDGVVFRDAMRREHAGRRDVDQALREANRRSKTKCVFLEAGGQITVLRNE
ncbi:MAG: hypothetical protein ABW069_02480 [Duganella sp.]